MEREGKKVMGTCRGLVVANQGTSIQGGLHSAIARGEGRIYSLDSNEVEVVEFVTTFAHTVIEVDKKWRRNS